MERVFIEVYTAKASVKNVVRLPFLLLQFLLSTGRTDHGGWVRIVLTTTFIRREIMLCGKTQEQTSQSTRKLTRSYLRKVISKV